MSDAPVPPAAPIPMSDADQRLWGTLIHLGWIVGSVVGLGFLPAVIGYLVLKDRGAFIRRHTAAALNFQVSWLIWGIGVGIIAVATLGIGALLFIPFTIGYIIFTILDALHANKGEEPGQNLSLTLVR